jgi:hypothetical protein
MRTRRAAFVGKSDDAFEIYTTQRILNGALIGNNFRLRERPRDSSKIQAGSLCYPRSKLGIHIPE